LLRLAAVLVVYWLAIGTLFWAYLEVVGPAALQWSRTVGAFGVSWGIGFFALFAPQGIGVFEGALVFCGKIVISLSGTYILKRKKPLEMIFP
jgi:hypothetical protein